MSAIQIQGRADQLQWVTSFTVALSNDGHDFQYVTSEGLSAAASDAFVFEGNTDQNTVIEQQLKGVFPFEARFVRLYPQTWHGHISLRWEIMSCTLYG